MKIEKSKIYVSAYYPNEGSKLETENGYIVNDEVGFFRNEDGGYMPVDLKSGLVLICFSEQLNVLFGDWRLNLMEAYRYYKENKEELFAGLKNQNYEVLCEKMKKFKENHNG